MVTGPLHGVSVVDVTRLLPGGFCSSLLSQLGARVIKVEEPGVGDYMRMTPPLGDGPSLVHSMVNRGKRSIAIDLKSKEGKVVLGKLVRKADVFIEGFRPGVMDRLGFSYASVRKMSPRVVYCSISVFGRSSDLGGVPGHDINFQAMAGLLGNVEEPRVPFVQYGDIASAMYATIGILAGLAQKPRKPIHVDVPIVPALLSWLILPASGYFTTGTAAREAGTLVYGSEPYYRLYRTSDGRHVAVAAIEPKFWRNLLRELGLSALESSRTGTREERVAATERLEEAFATRTRDEWVARLGDKDTCVTAVLDIEEALDSRWAHAARIVQEVSGKKVLNQPLRFDPELRTRVGDAPVLGEHTDTILREIGLSRSTIARLRSSGAVA